MSNRLDALRFITGALAPAAPKALGQLRADLVRGDFPWEYVVALANQHLVTPALWVGLRNRGLTALCPADVSEYCSELYRLNTRRNLGLKRQISEITATLNRVGVRPVLLKGAVHLFSRTRDVGLRVMSDIDLLVAKDELTTSLEALAAMEYRASSDPRSYRHQHHHWAPLWRPGDHTAVEVHWALACEDAENDGARMIPVELARQHLEDIDAGGPQAHALDPTYRMLHNIVHAEIVDENHRRREFALRALHDTVLINSEYGDRVCWPTVRERFAKHDNAKVLSGHLYAIRCLFGMATPSEIEFPAVTKAHFLCAEARVRWPWFARVTWGLQRMSARELRRLYGPELGWLPLLRVRLRHLMRVLAKHSRSAVRLT